MRVGVANAKIVVRSVDIPPLTDSAQIEAAVRQIAADELPMPLESAVLDYEPIGIVETSAGPRLRVVVIAARREMVESVLAAVTGAGLKPRGVDLSAFAMIRALGGGRADSALYLSVGGMANLAVVVDGVCLFTRVTGAGLEGMGIELAERRSLTLEHARMWLRHVGFEDDARRRSTASPRSSATPARSSSRARAGSRPRSAPRWSSIRPRPPRATTSAAPSSPASPPRSPASPTRCPPSSACPSRRATSAPPTELAATTDLGGMTVAAGLAVEAVSG